MPYTNLTVQSSKSSAWNTNSSGATGTVPAVVGKTAFVSAIRLLFGTALGQSNANLAITGLFPVPVTVQVGPFPNFQEFDFTSTAAGPVFSNAPNTAVVFTIAATQGGGDITLVVYYSYS